MRTIGVLVAGATLLGLSLPGAAQANLLTNGSFEDTTNFVNQGNDTMDLSVGSTLMPGWTVVGSHYVSWIGPTNPFGLTASPSGGSYFLDLTGYIAGAPYSGVSQTITTLPGAHYLLTFDLGSSKFWGLPDGLTASAGSASQTFTDTNPGANNNYWQSESLAFTATGTSTVVSLVGASGYNYIGLDDVSVVETSGPGVPEPAVWSMILVGMAGVGGTLRSRRNRNFAAA
ncbi:MAG TPA: DUF642 domain-containing protein [Caulobacteraceae bacterium]|nr:DUF642 domain-containing protein [Caulobacteraceae bacterium]